MSFDSRKGNCLCERCGHTWRTSWSYYLSKYVEPRSCAKCKSKGWNKPRVYGGKYLDGSAPMAKRYKPTGRQAKNIQEASRPENRRKDLVETVIKARNEVFRIEEEMREMKAEGLINDRYPSGREQSKIMDHIYNSASDDFLFWLNKLAEFDGIEERDSDAYYFYCVHNRHLLDIATIAQKSA